MFSFLFPFFFVKRFLSNLRLHQQAIGANTGVDACACLEAEVLSCFLIKAFGIGKAVGPIGSGNALAHGLQQHIGILEAR